MKAFTKFILGFFQDQGGESSSKRLITYVATFFAYMLVKASIEGKVIDSSIVMFVATIILFGIGAITTEFITKNYKKD